MKIPLNSPDGQQQNKGDKDPIHPKGNFRAEIFYCNASVKPDASYSVRIGYRTNAGSLFCSYNTKKFGWKLRELCDAIGMDGGLETDQLKGKILDLEVSHGSQRNDGGVFYNVKHHPPGAIGQLEDLNPRDQSQNKGQAQLSQPRYNDPPQNQRSPAYGEGQRRPVYGEGTYRPANDPPF